jgi:hypothetical protein
MHLSFYLSFLSLCFSVKLRLSSSLLYIYCIYPLCLSYSLFLFPSISYLFVYVFFYFSLPLFFSFSLRLSSFLSSLPLVFLYTLHSSVPMCFSSSLSLFPSVSLPLCLSFLLYFSLSFLSLLLAFLFSLCLISALLSPPLFNSFPLCVLFLSVSLFCASLPLYLHFPSRTTSLSLFLFVSLLPSIVSLLFASLILSPLFCSLYYYCVFNTIGLITNPTHVQLPLLCNHS